MRERERETETKRDRERESKRGRVCRDMCDCGGGK